MEPFFDNYKKVLPYFINDSPLPANGRERLQSPEQRARFDETTKCILCAACTTSCPSFWASDDYLGPAALVTAHRFIFDSRDEAAAERMQIVSETSGLARCHTIYNCTWPARAISRSPRPLASSRWPPSPAIWSRATHRVALSLDPTHTANEQSPIPPRARRREPALGIAPE